MASSPATKIIQTTTTSNTAAKNIGTHVIKVRAEWLLNIGQQYITLARHDIVTLRLLTSIATKAANRQSTSRGRRMQSYTSRNSITVKYTANQPSSSSRTAGLRALKIT